MANRRRGRPAPALGQSGALPGARPSMPPPPQQAEGEHGGEQKKADLNSAHSLACSATARAKASRVASRRRARADLLQMKPAHSRCAAWRATTTTTCRRRAGWQTEEGEGRTCSGWNWAHSRCAAWPATTPPQQAEGEQGGKQNKGKDGPQPRGIQSARHGPSIAPRSRNARSQTRQH